MESFFARETQFSVPTPNFQQVPSAIQPREDIIPQFDFVQQRFILKYALKKGQQFHKVPLVFGKAIFCIAASGIVVNHERPVRRLEKYKLPFHLCQNPFLQRRFRVRFLCALKKREHFEKLGINKFHLRIHPHRSKSILSPRRKNRVMRHGIVRIISHSIDRSEL